jgi:choline dehydrogenase-like flavoprotein
MRLAEGMPLSHLQQMCCSICISGAGNPGKRICGTTIGERLLSSATRLESAPADATHCIVGGGPVGLCLAARLGELGHRVILLEAGSGEASAASQSFYAGEVADPAIHWPLDTYRVRALGGTSSIWGGRSIPYDPIDFEPRPWVPHSDWPIGYDAVAGYYPAALAASRFDHTPSGPVVPGLDGEWLHTTIERFSRPTNFWTRYGRQLTKSENVRVITDAPVTGIRLAQDGGSVDHMEVTLPDGSKWQLRSRNYVLAAGGLETTRLLLDSDDVLRGGIGNAGGWLGRGYMCHLAATFGLAQFGGDPRRIGFDYDRDPDGIYTRRRIALTERAQRELGLLNFTARLHIHDANDPAHGDPVLSLIFLAAFAVKYEYSRAAREADRSTAVYLRHLGNIARHPVRLARFLGNWGVKRYFASRRIPSIALFSPTNRYPLEFHCEQAPNPDSRVTLLAERDALGQRRLRVDWRITDLDVASVRQSYDLLARELRRTGTGTLEFDGEGVKDAILSAGAYGGHHSGTARMSREPGDGVVNADCRVHGVGNLFVASSAVLPTSSQANPTLTALALALRLADHLDTLDARG